MSKVKIVNWNLRCSWDKDGINNFIHRAGMINEKLIEEQPEIIAFQEITAKNLKVMKQLMPDYTFVGHFRNEDYTGEGVFVAISKDSFDLIGTETIWLSPTPYIAGSRFENQSNCPRVCTMAQIIHKESGKLMRIYDIHLDHISDEARVLGMKCVFEFIEQYNAKLELPCVILGDFNARPESGVMQMCDEYSGIKEVTKDIDVTFHNYGARDIKIDYIYMSDELADKVCDVKAWKDERDGIFLSDHYPVCAELEM